MNKISAIVLACAVASPMIGADRVPPPAKILVEMQSAYAKVDSYTAVLVLQERRGDDLAPEEEIEFAFEKPFKVYMRWTGEALKGQELVFVAGENRNRIRMHRGGLLSFLPFSIDPSDPRAIEESHHAVTDAGIGKLIETLTLNFNRAAEKGQVESKTSFDDCQDARCIRWQADFDEGEPPYFGSRAVVYVNNSLKLPVSLVLYDKPDQLRERYEYRDLKLNVPIPPERFRLDR